MGETIIQKHFVLVHGAGHGAWCWYKVKPRLESAGHRVTAVDLAASGINTKELEEINSFGGYCEPLMELMASIPPNEKVIVVGHSFGGMSLAFAMDLYPEKISLAVFMSAYMPDTDHQPSYVIDKFLEEKPQEDWMDSQLLPYGKPQQPQTAIFAGPKFLRSALYHLSSDEDFSLAKMLVRPASLFIEDLKESQRLRKEAFGKVRRVFVVAVEDKIMREEFQRWMIENNPPTQVMDIEGADHMLMLSKPDQVSHYLTELANKYD